MQNLATLVKPALVKDEIELDLVGKPSFAIKNGVRLIKLFPDTNDFISINLFWNIDSVLGALPSTLPKALANSANTVETSKVLDNRFPVRGVRMSPTKTFGNVWYLLTKNTIANIGKLEFLTNSEDSLSAHKTYSEFAKGSATLESLDFYDSLNQKFIPCSHILAKDYEANCYNFNSQLNPDLWKLIKSGERFYVQLIVPLENGFILQTYAVGGLESQEPALIQQTFENDLLKYNIQNKFF